MKQFFNINLSGCLIGRPVVKYCDYKKKFNRTFEINLFYKYNVLSSREYV